ncbi:hypothetical protein DDB_G0291520 [Dictyostelium discoideum AX4]|uniref:RNA ligase domain-containing protein n=1 Tax=Dictyostelium discoideum TaxID=44689 RepID=Q54EG7_DICDI|nr:hypothetical protein DDB_G0291520 [Dictyostelium discoideum AX4]EAL61744.1 hypothetical protein DDB_G0291520 [Dictyostelium discoideum AX4]|eukprot:XP_635273.1 hypothetical protein DDB_G0291520 [Dictyostelium discoideum AX4]
MMENIEETLKLVEITDTTTTTTNTTTTNNQEVIIINEKKEIIINENDIEEGRDLDNESGRSLAYFERILKLEAIVGADVIEIATVLGWRVVVKKGLYKVGDPVVYCEIDSILPPWQYFIDDKMDSRGFKIKTIKLRGEISQGYCIPIKELINHPHKKIKAVYKEEEDNNNETIVHLLDEDSNEKIPIEMGRNLTDFIGIKKITEYVQIPRNVNGSNRKAYTFPSFIKRTDQTRIQSVPHYFDLHQDLLWEVTEKLEGSSITVFKKGKESGVCSRNFLIEDFQGSDIHQAVIEDLDLLNRLSTIDLNIALQGEILGPKIQGNIYQLRKNYFKIFDIFLIDSQRYATHDERIEILNSLKLTPSDHMAPVISNSFSLKGKTLSDILDMANGFSILKESKPKILREGLVFKSTSTIGSVNQSVVSFKAISNQYLLKKK